MGAGHFGALKRGAGHFGAFKMGAGHFGALKRGAGHFGALKTGAGHFGAHKGDGVHLRADSTLILLNSSGAGGSAQHWPANTLNFCVPLLAKIRHSLKYYISILVEN